MLNVKELRILNTTKCECGHEFTLKDIKSIDRINEQGFYSNIVKNYSESKCPQCGKTKILLVKQVGQTWKIVNIATTDELQTMKVQLMTSQVVTTQPETKNKTNNTLTNEFICPVCEKVCKSKIGLNSHIKTHQNS